MKQTTIRVMNIKTGKVFDMTQTAMDSLKKYKLFHQYMVINEKPKAIPESNPILNAPKTETTETTETEFPGFTNYVETENGTRIEMDNEKPKRKYQKQPK